MAILRRYTFALVFAALLAPSANAQVRNFAECKCTNEDIRINPDCDSFTANQEGSQRRTFGNLCTGTRTERERQQNSPTTDTDIDSRNDHQFRIFCDLISDNPRVLQMMAKGQDDHTVFAPTDAAFLAIPGVIGLLGAGGTARLLELHILPQALLTDDLRCGQLRRTIDDGVLNAVASPRNRQRSRTRCITANRIAQLGPGNQITKTNPTIGRPRFVFKRDEFQFQRDFSNVAQQGNNDANNIDNDYISQDIIACNGVIHVVDQVLIPGNQWNGRNGGGYGTKGGYGYGTKGGGYGTKGGYNGSGYNGYYGTKSGNRNGYGNNYRRGNKGGKFGKGGKGGKGGKAYGYYGIGTNGNYNNGGIAGYGNGGNNGYGYGGFRNLEIDEMEDESFMNDAEFFGTQSLQEPSAENSEADNANRKRRLEALLGPDGNIAQV